MLYWSMVAPGVNLFKIIATIIIIFIYIYVYANIKVCLCLCPRNQTNDEFIQSTYQKYVLQNPIDATHCSDRKKLPLIISNISI